MLLGKMCNPEKDVIDEVTWIIQNKLDFAEITIESPGARPERNWQTVKDLVEKNKLKVVGSTDYNLQIASPWVPVRKASMMQIIRAFPILEMLGAELVHIHLDDSAKRERENMFKWNSEAIGELYDMAAEHGLKLMVENGRLAQEWQFELFQFVLKENPKVYFNLDVGHANLGVKKNLTPKLLKFFGKRLAHVHVHDNNGTEDQHLELGKGNIDWKKIVHLLKKVGYDGTITLETFYPEERKAFVRSKKYFEALWGTK